MPKATPLVAAAQYLRMSTDKQECSIQNQAVMIQRYADSHGFTLIKTYEDAGKSGLTIAQRRGLQSLLTDVLERRAAYRAVLVYDVSRWGRFQDADEAAHYEFLCKSSGVSIYYCAEEFGPDDTLPSRVMKALKRTMAAEFSRELSLRVFISKQRRAQMGFHQGSNPGYALRRVVVDRDGVVKQTLRPGELKNKISDHVVLLPGPEREQKWVRWIYQQRINGLQIGEIIHELNVRKIPWTSGKPWNRYKVRQVLTNRKYAGWNCWAQTTQKLRTKPRQNPRDQWVEVEGAFKGVVDQATFDRAQVIIKQRLNYKSNETVLRGLKKLWMRHGSLSESIIDRTKGVPCTSSLRTRFGSMVKVYELLGFRPEPVHALRTQKSKTMLRLRAQIFASIREHFPYDAIFVRPSIRHRHCIAFEDVGDVNVVLCRSFAERNGLCYWVLYVRPLTRGLPALVCLMSRNNESIEKYYVMPKIDAITRMTLTAKDPWFQSGIQLKSLSELHSALIEVKTWVPLGRVYRGFSNMYAQLMGPCNRSWIHHFEREEATACRDLRRT